MKKLAVILSLFMLVGAVPGWCLVATVDNYVDTHTKNSGYRPVQDTGEMYGAINHGIGTAMDKVPVIKERQVVVSPIEKLANDTIHGTRTLLNGMWDVLTLKSMREKK